MAVSQVIVNSRKQQRPRLDHLGRDLYLIALFVAGLSRFQYHAKFANSSA